jgi:putative hydrolase of the HAD superfamily
MADIELIFFDIGGVLGTNGWDHEQRAAAIAQFGLDKTEFEYRHRELIQPWEEGRITIDEYLDLTVFYTRRSFSRQTFSEFMFAQSHPFPEMIALARKLHHNGQYRLMTLNNESRELNHHRIHHFGLTEIFGTFLTSCYLSARKPMRAYYDRALGIAQAAADRAVFIDDREQNITPARALGLHTILHTSVANTTRCLSELGVTIASPLPHRT